MLVQEQPQVGQDVFTFLALEQVELVDTGHGQLVFRRIVLVVGVDARPELLGLAVATDEDAGFQSFLLRQAHQFLEDPAAFADEVVRLMDDDGVTGNGGCGLAGLGIDVVDRHLAEETVQAAFGSFQEELRSPVVGRKGDFPGMIGLAELFQNVFRIGAAPFVNGLEVIAAEEDVAAGEEAADDGIFDFARVLHFIDGDEAEPVPPALAAGFVCEEVIGAGDEVREIDGVVVGQDGIVLPDEVVAVVMEPGLEGFFRRREIVEVREDALFLGKFDIVLQGLGVIARCRRRRREVVDELPAVFVIVEEKIIITVALALCFLFDEAVTETVDRLDDDVQALFVGRSDDAFLQLLAGPVGEGQTEYLRAFSGLRFQDMGDPAGQDTGLARAGRGVEQDGLRQVADDLLLLVI